MATNFRSLVGGGRSTNRTAIHRIAVPVVAVIVSLAGRMAVAQDQALAAKEQTPTTKEQASVANEQGPQVDTAPSETAGPPAGLAEVTVTGSRIARTDGYQAPTPVAILGSDDLNKMAATNLADAVNRLPEFTGSLTTSNVSTNVGAGVTGVNNLNLRSLGADRTLVLLDGQRIVGSTLTGTGSSNNGGAVDINVIPSGLIKRVEVVTGGASAVYGSDALAGVVNFILDKDFTGVKASVDGGITTYGDDANYKVDITAGLPFADNRGHFLFNAEHSNDNGVSHTGDRPWMDAAYELVNNPAYTATNGQPQLIKIFNAGLANATPGGLIVSCPLAPGAAPVTTACPLRGTQFVTGGTPIGFQFGKLNAGTLMSGGDYQQSRIDEIPMLDVPLQRDNLYGRGSYALTDKISGYVEVMWSWTEAFNRAVVPNFDLGNLTIYSGNPFIPPFVQAQMTAHNIPSFVMGTTNGDMGYLQGDDDRRMQRYTAGLEGNYDLLGKPWKWDGYYTRGLEDISARTPGDQITANYKQAIQAVVGPNGQIECSVNADSNPNNNDPNCVPYNPMGTGVNSAAALAYVTGTGWEHTVLTQDVVAISTSGEPISSWAGPVSIAFGAEHRRESVDGDASALDEMNAYFAGNYHASHGAYDVSEGFIETVVPLAKDLPLLKSLDFNGAARYTDYSTSGGVDTWKLGATWAPVDDIHFRVTRSRDIRAPNLGELYNAGLSLTGNVVDPVANRTYTIVSRTTGNPDLKPEIADTIGIGVVFTPTFIRGFALSVDYYNIDIAGAIASLSTQQNVDRCYEGFTQLCAFITRDPVTGLITTVHDEPFNILEQKAAGLDVESSYNFPLFKGDVALRAMGTYVTQLETVDTTGIVNGVGVNADDAGTGVGNALISPKFRYLLSATYSLSAVSITLTGRGISSGKYNNSFIACELNCPALPVNSPLETIDSNHIAGVTYVDFGLNYTVYKNDELYFVVENMLNRDPPLVAGGTANGYYNGQSNATFYDRLGRMFHAGARFKF